GTLRAPTSRRAAAMPAAPAPITATSTSDGRVVTKSGADRLRVLAVADVLAPGRALPLLAGFRQGEMREKVVGRGAVPMHRVGRDVDDIAGIDRLRRLALEADAADPAAA